MGITMNYIRSTNVHSMSSYYSSAGAVIARQLASCHWRNALLPLGKIFQTTWEWLFPKSTPPASLSALKKHRKKGEVESYHELHHYLLPRDTVSRDKMVCSCIINHPPYLVPLSLVLQNKKNIWFSAFFLTHATFDTLEPASYCSAIALLIKNKWIQNK